MDVTGGNVELGVGARNYSTERDNIPSNDNDFTKIPTSKIPRPDLRPDSVRFPSNDPPPQPYYWERNSTEVATMSIWRKAAHCAHYYVVKALDKGEAVGEVVAHVCGYTQSHYQYVIDALEREEYQRQLEENTQSALSN